MEEKVWLFVKIYWLPKADRETGLMSPTVPCWLSYDITVYISQISGPSEKEVYLDNTVVD